MDESNVKKMQLFQPTALGLEMPYARLSELLEMRWLDNPKIHMDALVEQSILDHGYNDPPEVDVNHRLLVVGHGRCEALSRIKAAGEKIPQNISVHPDGDWLVPVIRLAFETLEDAYRYCLTHNRTGVRHLSPEDYDGVRLSRALKSALAGAGQQAVLPGFGGEDMMLGGGIGTGTGGLELPALPVFDAQPVFDPGKLEGVPGYQAGQAPQSYVAMVAFRDQEELKRGMIALTGGKRTGVQSDTKAISLNGSELLPLWEAKILGDGAALAEQVNPQSVGALPGQITMAGAVVGSKPADIPLLPEQLTGGPELPGGLLMRGGMPDENWGPSPVEKAAGAIMAKTALEELVARHPLWADNLPGSQAWADQQNEPPPPQVSEPGDPNYGQGAWEPAGYLQPIHGSPLKQEERAQLERVVAEAKALAAETVPAKLPVGKYAGLAVPPIVPIAGVGTQPSLLPDNQKSTVTVGVVKSRGKKKAEPVPASGGEPKWVGGLCAICGGSKFTGYRKVDGAKVKMECEACEGAGDRESWLKSKGLA